MWTTGCGEGGRVTGVELDSACEETEAGAVGQLRDDEEEAVWSEERSDDVELEEIPFTDADPSKEAAACLAKEKGAVDGESADGSTMGGALER